MINLKNISVLTANENCAVVSVLTQFENGNTSVVGAQFSFTITQAQLRAIGESFVSEANKMMDLPVVETEFKQKQVRP